MTPDERGAYFAQKRAIAKTERDNDLKKDAAGLLEDIHDESLADPNIERDPGLTVARTMARFSALQIALSKEADATAVKNLRLQRLTFWTAIAALVISIVQLVIPLVKKEQSVVTEPDFIQIRYQRSYQGDSLKEFEQTHGVPQPFPRKDK